MILSMGVANTRLASSYHRRGRRDSPLTGIRVMEELYTAVSGASTTYKIAGGDAISDRVTPVGLASWSFTALQRSDHGEANVNAGYGSLIDLRSSERL